jgi:Holliday junction resolvase RusA-like endonuclease
MTILPGFVIKGAPRTKKNHGRIITITPKGQKRSVCHQCNRPFGRQFMLPSEQYLEWEGNALSQCFNIKRELARAGVSLPVVGLVSIEAHIYRETNVGDTAGYIQAIGDMLQKAEIIKNDSQIEDWDGTRRFKDAIHPRVEIFISIVEERAVQENLLI